MILAGGGLAGDLHKPQQLLHRDRNQAGIGAEPVQFRRMVAERHERHVELVGGGFVARHQQAEAEPHEFGLRQPVPGVAGFDEHTDQVVGRCLPLLRDQVGHVPVHREVRLRQLAHRPAPVGEQGVRPAVEGIDVAGGNAEQ
ncbi:MAG: hypothetical protein WAK28_18210 [Trebonia sp.]